VQKCVCDERVRVGVALHKAASVDKDSLAPSDEQNRTQHTRDATRTHRMSERLELLRQRRARGRMEGGQTEGGWTDGRWTDGNLSAGRLS